MIPFFVDKEKLAMAKKIVKKSKAVKPRKALKKAKPRKAPRKNTGKAKIILLYPQSIAIDFVR